jgi:hypothetical protein
MISIGMSTTWRALARGALLLAILITGPALAQGVFPLPAAAPDVAVRITGTVEVIVPYGTGYVIGGSFDQVNGEPRRNLALLDASGALADSGLAWAAQGADGTVRALAVSGDDVFVGGEFSAIGGSARTFLAKLSLTGAGAVDAGFAPVLDGQVRALATDGATVYAGGAFGSANGAARDALAAFDAASGSLVTGFVPGYRSAEAVNALALDGTQLYVGGKLQATHPSSGHNRAIARLAAANGALDTGWLARIHPRGGAEVWSIAVGADSVYIAGQFRSVGQGGGNNRSNLAELLKTDAGRTAWNPGADAPVRAIALVSDGLGGETLLAAGDFTTIGGGAHTFLAHIDATGAATAFSADADRPVRAVLAAGANAVVGGAFRALGGELEEGLARVDIATGARDATFTGAVAGPGAVHAFAFDEAGGIVFGGEFDSVTAGGVSHLRANLARLAADLSLDTGWTLDVAGAVHAIAVDSINHRLYLGGAFLQVADGSGGTAARQRLAAYDTTAAPALLGGWTPAADGTVTGLVLDAGSRLYVHGQFIASPRAFVARLDSSGAVDSFDAAVDGPVHALAVDGSTVLLGGEFSTAGGAAHDNLARVHADTDGVLGTVAGGDAGLVADADGSVRALLVDASGTYVAGGFGTLQAQARAGVARLDALDAVDGWNPGVVGSVSALANVGGWMVLGGSFGNAGGAVHPNIARASVADALGAVDPAWRPGTSDPVAQLAASGVAGDVLLAGAFDTVTGVTRGGLALLGDQGSDLTEVTIGAITPEPSVVGQAWAVPFTVQNTTAGAAASGEVTVTTDAGESCGPVALDAGGAGACEITSGTAGARQVTVSYVSGAAEVMDSSALAAHAVDAGATTLTVATGPNPSQTGSAVLVAVDLAVQAPAAGTPTGTVTVGSVDASLVAGPGCSITLPDTSCELTFTAAGTYTVSAAYAGDGNFAAAADDTTHMVMDVVVALPTTTTIAALAPTVVGETYTVSVQVDAGLEVVGTVDVSDGSATCQITLQPGDTGAGSCDLASTSAGDKVISASYVGNASFEASADTELHTVNQAATALGLFVDSAILTAGDDAVFTWTLDVVLPGAGSPTGTVTVSDGATQCSAPVADGGCTIPAMVEGNYAFSASYSGDGDFLADSSDGTVPVTVGAGGAILADVVVRHEIVGSGILSDGSGDLVDYELEVSNAGGTAANGVVLDLMLPPEFVPADTAWTCTGSGGASCGSASGTGDIAFSVDLPPASSVLVELSTRIVDPDDAGVETAASATSAGSELSLDNNAGTTFYRACSASELLVVGEFTSLPPHVCGFRDGFEDRGID